MNVQLQPEIPAGVKEEVEQALNEFADAEIQAAWKEVEDGPTERPEMIAAWSDEEIEEWLNDPRR